MLLFWNEIIFVSLGRLLRCAQIILHGRRHVSRSALEAEPLKSAAEAVSKLAVGSEIKILAVDGRLFHQFALHRDHGAAPNQLLLPRG